LFNFFWIGLKFLVRICTDLGLKDAQDYAAKLKRAEKVSKMREEVGGRILIV
jgi:ribosomal protein L7/L12